MPTPLSLRAELLRLEARYGREAVRAELDRLPELNQLAVFAASLEPKRPPGKRGRNVVNDDAYLDRMAMLIAAAGGFKRSPRDPNGMGIKTAAMTVLRDAGVPDRLHASRADTLRRKFRKDAARRVADAERAQQELSATAIRICRSPAAAPLRR